MLYGIVLAAVAAAGCTIALALTSDHLSEPGVQAALMVWVVVPYVLAGVICLVAPAREPVGAADDRRRFRSLSLGALLGEYRHPVHDRHRLRPRSGGSLLHVFLAFPSGRLELWYERALVAAGYATAFGVHLFGMLLGGFGPDNVIALTSDSHASYELLRAELVVLAAVCLAGIGVLALGDRIRAPLRRSLALLIDSFALGLVMLAVLLLAGAFGGLSGQLRSRPFAGRPSS